MGAITMTGIEERQCVGPRGLTASGRSSNREECSRRVPLIGGAAHTHDGIDGPPFRTDLPPRITYKPLANHTGRAASAKVQNCQAGPPTRKSDNLIL